MENKSSLNVKVDKALSSINNIEPATPSPYFYSKILAKIGTANVNIWERWSAFFLRPTIAFSAVLFIIVINAFVLYSKIDSDTYSIDQTETASLDEYNVAATALYDLENEKP